MRSNPPDSSASSTQEDQLKHTRSGRCIKFNSDYTEKCAKKRQRQNLMYQVKKALKKCSSERTKDDNDLLANCEDLVKHVDICEQNRLIAQAHQEIILDDPDLLELKCQELADAMLNAKKCVFYTGAGISTSASIPDYRGPNGLWTLLEKGHKIKLPDFTKVKPTFSHMALAALVECGLVSHVVSQNCDGLHLRSGLDRDKLSELHGNCFIEFCIECSEEYCRLFDVTERSSFRKHVTGRYCTNCNKPTKSTKNQENNFQLRDSIIHFGEKLKDGSPFNWEEARDSVKQAKLIICLGTSLKVLKHYACLWPKKKSPDIAIVSIQWTPKDKVSKIKINGYCDQIMKFLIDNLSGHLPGLKVKEYSLNKDPLFKLAVKLDDHEMSTTTKPFLMNSYEEKLTANSAKTELELINNQPEYSPAKGEEGESTKNENLDSWFTKSFKPRKKPQPKKSLKSKNRKIVENC